MSQITKTSLALAMVMGLCVLCLAGCGDTNPQATFDSVAGVHKSGWLNGGHSKAALEHVENCTQCHGQDFQGGTSKVACTQCHMESAQAPHPSFWNYTSQNKIAWGKYAYALHARTLTQGTTPNDTTACANAVCHGTDLSGVPGSGPSCSSCHMGGTFSVHPTSWKVQLTQPVNAKAPTIFPDHGAYVNANGTASCRNVACHGDKGEGVFLSGPACVMCHY